MTSWIVDHVRQVQWGEVLSIRRTANGPYKAAIEVAMRVRESTFTLVYELRADDPQVYMHLSGTWLERGSREAGVPVLRLSVPLAMENAKGRYEIPFGAIDRGINDGREVPALRWAQVNGTIGGQGACCLLLNDCKYGHALEGSTLHLTLIRSSYDPDGLPEIRQHEVRMALLGAAGEISMAEAIRRGAAFNHPLCAVGTGIHDGRLGLAGQFLAVEGDSVILSTVKKAEDGEALILRFSETAGREALARVRFDKGMIGRPMAAQEVDLLERVVEGGTATVNGQEVSLKVPAHGIASVKVSLER